MPSSSATNPGSAVGSCTVPRLTTTPSPHSSRSVSAHPLAVRLAERADVHPSSRSRNTRSAIWRVAVSGIEPAGVHLVEQRAQLGVGLEGGVEPAAGLSDGHGDDLVLDVLAPLGVEPAVALQEGAVVEDGLPQRLGAFALERLGLDDRHAPLAVAVEREHRADLGSHRPRGRVVGLVDDDDVGDLHDARLERLDRVARPRLQHEDDRVGDRSPPRPRSAPRRRSRAASTSMPAASRMSSA